VRARTLLAVASGGAVGAWLRYEANVAFPALTPPQFPWTTFAVNVLGSFLLGLLMTLVLEHWPPTRYVRPFAAIGILGGFTTFSTFEVEVVRLTGAHQGDLALTYAILSLLAGLVAVAAGAAAATAVARIGRGPRPGRRAG
jgi:fluoride exporter